MNQNYIEKQVSVYLNSPYQAVREDALWRIASEADLIPAEVQRVEGAVRTFVIDWLYQNGFIVDSEG